MEMIDLLGLKANVAFVDMYGILRPVFEKDCKIESYESSYKVTSCDPKTTKNVLKIRITKAPTIDFVIDVDMEEVESFIGGFTGTITASSFSPSKGTYTNILITK